MVVIEKMIRSVYIHIPFCKNICSYCNFSKMYYNKDQVDRYLKALEKEIKSCYKNDIISTIYIGGGTPSDLGEDKLERLFKIVQMFKLDISYEFTFECNISITEEKLKILKKYGVNRLSFGIETVNDKFLNIMDRYHTRNEIRDKINTCRKLGFSNINGDLMYAFNGESLEDLRDDISFILSLNLEHISTYSLIIEEHTKLYLKKFTNCDEETDSKMYFMICDILNDNNYEHYEVSNFAKSGFRSKHNLTYWKNEKYYGFGLSASGYIDDIRYTNTGSISKYVDGFYKYEIEKMNKYDKISYEMILGLRTIEGIRLDEFYKKYKIKLEEVFDIRDLILQRCLIINEKRVYIPYDKWYVMNNILEKFVR